MDPVKLLKTKCVAVTGKALSEYILDNPFFPAIEYVNRRNNCKTKLILSGRFSEQSSRFCDV